jgi:protein tyrosine/serine phosphatase
MSNWEFWSPYMRAWRKTWSGDISRPKSRFYAYLDMLIFDHGLFRCLYQNRHRVSEQLERQSHPTPWSVAAAARRGIKTIINLRGDNHLGSTLLSSEACVRHGITLVNYKAYSRRTPSKETILGLKQLFDSVQYPVMIHCKSGADRAGIVSALYLMLCRDQPVAVAKRQLRWQYGHVRLTNTGILDCFLEAYEKANEAQPIDFLTWVETRYDPDDVKRHFKVSRWGSLLDRIMNRE